MKINGDEVGLLGPVIIKIHPTPLVTPSTYKVHYRYPPPEGYIIYTKGRVPDVTSKHIYKIFRCTEAIFCYT